MPSLSRVLRHIEALITADPANAEQIRAALPDPAARRVKKTTKPAAKNA